MNSKNIKNETKNAKKEHQQYFQHLLRYQKLYLCGLFILLSALSFFSNYLQEKPLLMGGESYYFLSSAREEVSYHPLTLLLRTIPPQRVFLVPPLIALGNILLFYALARKLGLPEKIIFFTVLFYILTPAFIFASLTLSSHSVFLLLVLLGMNLLLQETKKKYLALLPFLIASLMDTFSALLLLIGLAGYFFSVKKIRERFSVLLLLCIAAVIIVGSTLLHAPFFLGPFTIQNKAADVVSDLGALSGAGVFTILLAIIGLITSWQKRNSLLRYLLLAFALLIAGYLLNTHTIFFLSLFLVALAALGFVNLLKQHWKLSSLRSAVLLLLLLGISFSAVAYLDRLSSYSPTAIDQKSLEWIKLNTDKDAVVLSAPENSYYISYFAQRKPVFALHQQYGDDYNLSQKMFSAYYIHELFPLLEENNVSLVYVSDKMNQILPQEQEFLFLLQNERFKLLYFTDEAEVWSFEKIKTG